MNNFDNTYAQDNMNNKHDSSDSEDENQVGVPNTITVRPVNYDTSGS